MRKTPLALSARMTRGVGDWVAREFGKLFQQKAYDREAHHLSWTGCLYRAWDTLLGPVWSANSGTADIQRRFP